MTIYRTKSDYIFKIVHDSVNFRWRPSTNDFEIFNKYIADLNWKTKEEAQTDLDKIAKKLDLKEVK